MAGRGAIDVRLGEDVLDRHHRGAQRPRIGGQVRMGLGWGIFANASHERRLYGGTDPAFLVRREDRQYEIAAGISYLMRASTTLVVQLQHTRNDSNIVINDFDRTVASLAVRMNF